MPVVQPAPYPAKGKTAAAGPYHLPTTGASSWMKRQQWFNQYNCNYSLFWSQTLACRHKWFAQAGSGASLESAEGDSLSLGLIRCLCREDVA